MVIVRVYLGILEWCVQIVCINPINNKDFNKIVFGCHRNLPIVSIVADPWIVQMETLVFQTDCVTVFWDIPEQHAPLVVYRIRNYYSHKINVNLADLGCNAGCYLTCLNVGICLGDGT